MNEILNNMFENLVVYIWNNPLDDDDFGAILIHRDDIEQAKEFSEYISTRQKARSFNEFVNLLDRAEIPFYLIGDVDMYVHTE